MFRHGLSRPYLGMYLGLGDIFSKSYDDILVHITRSGRSVPALNGRVGSDAWPWWDSNPHETLRTRRAREATTTQLCIPSCDAVAQMPLVVSNAGQEPGVGPLLLASTVANTTMTLMSPLVIGVHHHRGLRRHGGGAPLMGVVGYAWWPRTCTAAWW
jgi:hypothetical protein